MTTPLDVVRDFNFDWVRGLSEVWTDYWDDEQLNAEARQIFAEKFQRLIAERPDGIQGWIIVGQAGAGKTHLLGAFRRKAWQSNATFILVDMTGVRDFWETLRQAILDSLQQKVDDQCMQYQKVLATTIAKLGVKEPLAKVLRVLSHRKTETLKKDIAKVLPHFARVYSNDALRHQDVIRALLCWNSEDFAISSIGHSWLHGQPLSEDERQSLGFTQSHLPAQQFVKSLTWLLSRSGPTVIAFDQMDTLVRQYHVAKMSRPDSEAAVEALAIIQNVGDGLGSLRDHTHLAMPVIACLESSFPILQNVIPQAYLDRFDDTPHALRPIHSATVGEAIVRQRVEETFKKLAFTPPSAVWPFHPDAFRDAESLTPRELLKHCNRLRQQWVRQGRVDEVRGFGEQADGPKQPSTSDSLSGLDQRFEELKRAADVASVIDEKAAERVTPNMLAALFQCLDMEGALPSEHRLDGLTEFTGGTTTKPLHGRLSVVDEANEDSEEVYCYRAIHHANARAFQARLRAAMTESGVDRRLPFRSLSIIRRGPMPGGPLTAKLVDEFEQSGGRWVEMGEEEIRSALALEQLHRDSPEGFERWLSARQPVSRLSLLQDVLQRTDAKPPPANEEAKRPQPAKVIAPKTETPDDIILGRKLDAAASPISLPLAQLCKHTLLVAGSGSGKTVLLKRLVEEAALRGVPSLVIDPIGNLSQLGEEWREPPPQWTPEDKEAAQRFRQSTEVVVWTPGLEGGRPLSLELLPDLRQSVGTADELEAAVAMTKEMLSPIVAPGRSQKDQHKRGILHKALREFVQTRSSLVAFIEYLRDLPDKALLGIANEAKMAGEMADTLAAKREQDPLLRSAGEELDPSTLFTSTDGRTRVSVINFRGLQATESQQVFLGQLATTLFGWLKRGTGGPRREVEGLLVVDEARNYVPSRGATPCREGFLRLAAQARNYRFGLLFATQNPKDIVNTIVSQCSTHMYGKMNAPATIEAVRELLKEKGAAGDDVPRLGRGEFYAHNADCIPKATKIKTRMCLSRHE